MIGFQLIDEAFDLLSVEQKVIAAGICLDKRKTLLLTQTGKDLD